MGQCQMHVQSQTRMRGDAQLDTTDYSVSMTSIPEHNTKDCDDNGSIMGGQSILCDQHVMVCFEKERMVHWELKTKPWSLSPNRSQRADCGPSAIKTTPHVIVMISCTVMSRTLRCDALDYTAHGHHVGCARAR